MTGPAGPAPQPTPEEDDVPEENGVTEEDGAAADGWSYRRPRPLLLWALAISGLWPSLWFAGLLLIPMSFWATWPGRWQPRHWIMTATGLVWAVALAVNLAGSADRADLGLGSWQAPEWMVSLATSAPLAMWAVQAAALGGFVWALWSDDTWLSGRGSSQ